jgi:hypothetical protein
MATPNEFQAAVLSSLFLYSRAAYTEEPIDKAVHVLSSLESLLLKNENEPIQQNLGERVAVFLESGLDARKAVIRVIKETYSFRSPYLHHGQFATELDIVQGVLIIAWRFYVKLLTVVGQHTTRLGFVQAIDDEKLG